MDNVGLFFLIFGLSNHSQLSDLLMIFGARYLIYFTFLLAFILAFKSGAKEKRALILTILFLPIIILIIILIHIFFFEPRPFVNFHFSPLIPYSEDASFPSRHASIMSAMAFAYTYYKSKWAPFFLFLMLWVGIARIYVGVHYPLDILGGFIVGVISLMITLQIKRLLRITFLSKSF